MSVGANAGIEIEGEEGGFEEIEGVGDFTGDGDVRTAHLALLCVHLVAASLN